LEELATSLHEAAAASLGELQRPSMSDALDASTDGDAADGDAGEGVRRDEAPTLSIDLQGAEPVEPSPVGNPKLLDFGA
jgi:hypothetical protein